MEGHPKSWLHKAPRCERRFDAVVTRLLTFLARVPENASAIIGNVADPPAADVTPDAREPFCHAGRGPSMPDQGTAHLNQPRHRELLAGIASPADLKRLSMPDLNLLAAEIREELIEVVTRNGGHLGASLGT